MSEGIPPWEAPFVVDVPSLPAERHGSWDLYDPVATGRRPVVVFVHGGPLPVDWPVSPRNWPVYRGYGALAAAAGVVGVTVDHPLHSLDDLPAAHAVVVQAVEAARADARVDEDRVAVWGFSGGGPLLSPWLAQPPSWLRCLAATYPVLDSRPDRVLPGGFRPIDALAADPRLPFVLTRVGNESVSIADGVARFLTAAQPGRLQIQVVDVPNGHHAFDMIDPGPESVAAVEQAIELVIAAARA